MGKIYFQIFWIPAVASAAMLVSAGLGGLLSRPVPLWLWFGVALVLQVKGSLLSPMWAVGLTLQALLGIYLAIRIKLG